MKTLLKDIVCEEKKGFVWDVCRGLLSAFSILFNLGIQFRLFFHAR